MPPNQTNPYTLHTTLEPNHIYSCFGIKLKVKEQVDTFSNSGNFSIHINNINLQELESQNKGITKDTPIFCYVQDSKQTHIAKLQDKNTTIKIQIDKNLPKDSNGNIIPIISKLIFLSFIPFRDTKEANNSPSQKIQLTADDINKGYYNVDFMIPLRCFGEWEGSGECNKYKNIPTISKAKDRKDNIIKNTPAIFEIDGYKSGIIGDIGNFLKRNLVTPNIFEEVTNNENLISIYAEKYNIDSDLVRAIIFLETTHGYYDRLYDTLLKQPIEAFKGEQESFRPMNINYSYWKELIDKMGYTKEQIKNDPSANLDVGCLLLK
ncbi:hypothetical protein [Helicobacter sp. T3_23-1059]